MGVCRLGWGRTGRLCWELLLISFLGAHRALTFVGERYRLFGEAAHGVGCLGNVCLSWDPALCFSLWKSSLFVGRGHAWCLV